VNDGEAEFVELRLPGTEGVILVDGPGRSDAAFLLGPLRRRLDGRFRVANVRLRPSAAPNTQKPLLAMIGGAITRASAGRGQKFA
jgi:hypothetical protein